MVVVVEVTVVEVVEMAVVVVVADAAVVVVAEAVVVVVSEVELPLLQAKRKKVNPVTNNNAATNLAQFFISNYRLTQKKESSKH